MNRKTGGLRVSIDWTPDNQRLHIISIVIIWAVMEPNLAFVCSDIARLFRKRFAEAARNVGSTGPQWRALLSVQKCPGINQGALAERLDVEPISACRMIDRLEQAGLVERRRDPSDRRVWQIFLTEAATPVVEQLHEIGVAMLDQSTSTLSAEEIERLFTYLSRVRDTLLMMDESELMSETSNG